MILSLLLSPRSRLASALLLSPLLTMAQTSALPTQRSGVTGKELAAIRLPPDIDMSKGRTLRMREVTIAPGGFLPMHSHADRPSVFYVLKGTLTEHLEGEAEGKPMATGQAHAIHGAKGHALQNQGDVPAVFIEVDLP